MDFVLIAAVALTVLFVHRRLSMRENILFASAGDDDMRIAAPVSAQKRKVESEDSAADDYVTHQTMGNIETAMQLGGCLARLFCTRYRELSEQQKSEIAEQLIILDSYAVNRVVQNLANSLIAQTVLSTFYKIIGQESAELYQAVRDPVPFSLYILRDRKSYPTESYGQVFASLCGAPDSAELTALADTEYASFFEQCETLAKGFSFQKV